MPVGCKFVPDRIKRRLEYIGSESGDVRKLSASRMECDEAILMAVNGADRE